MKTISRDRWLQHYGVLIAFVILFLVNAVWQPSIFLQPENLKNLINQNCAVGLISIGMTFVIITGGIDLSVGSMLALAASIGLVALNARVGQGASEGAAVMVGIAATIGVGTVGGLINGLVIAYGRIVPFVTTLIGLLAFRSMALAIAEGGEIRSKSAEIFPDLGRGGLPIPFMMNPSGKPVVITWIILIFISMALVGGFLLNRTRFGRHVIAIGANERAAVYSGINVRRVKIATYSFAGLCVGLAALAASTRMNSVATSSTGLYMELDAIAAVVIGGTSLRGGYGRIWGTFVGVILLGLINNMLVLAGVSPYWQGVVKGAIILFAVLLQRGREDV